MGFFSGFVKGAADKAVNIRDTREAERKELMKEAMQDLRETIKQRQAKIDEMAKHRRLGAAVAGFGGMDADTATGLAAAGFGADMLTDGRITARTQQAPQAAVQAPAQVAATTPAAIPTEAPQQAPQAIPEGIPTSTASAPTTTAAMGQPTQAPQPMPEAAPKPGMMQQVGAALFGRDPREGLMDQARNQMAQNRGQSREEFDSFMNAPIEAPAVRPGSLTMSAFTPVQKAQLAQNFTSAEGAQRFFNSNGQDTSGLTTFQDKANLEREMAQMAAASRMAAANARGAREPNDSQVRAASNFVNQSVDRLMGAKTITDPATGQIRMIHETAEKQAQAAQVSLRATEILAENGYSSRVAPQAIQQAARELGVDMPMLRAVQPPAAPGTARERASAIQRPQSTPQQSSDAQSHVASMRQLIAQGKDGEARQLYNNLPANVRAEVDRLTSR